MIAALVVLLCVLGCVVVAASPLPTSELMDPDGPRAQAQRRAELRLGGSILAVTAFACLSLMAVSYGARWPLVPLCAALLAATIVLHPWLVVRLVLIPLGAARAAYKVSLLGGHPWARDPEGGAVLAGALARLRARNRDAGVNAELVAHLDTAPLRGAGIVAAGLLAADRNDRSLAKLLLHSVELLDPDVAPTRARSIATDWLVADAAAEGRWGDVLERVRAQPWPSRTAQLMGLAAQRLLGDAVSEPALRRAWLRAPRRRMTRPLLKLALRQRCPIECAEAGADDRHGALAANHDPSTVLCALAQHVEAACRPAGEALAPEAMERVASAWDATLWTFDFRASLRARTFDLGCRATVEEIARDFSREVARGLATMMSPGWRTVATARRGLLERALAVFCGRIAGELHAACVDLHAQRVAMLRPTALRVWERAIRVRTVYERGARVAGLRLTQAAYPVAERELAGAAVWFWNKRGERALANAVSLWLLAEAERVADERAAAHHRKNAAAGL